MISCHVQRIFIARMAFTLAIKMLIRFAKQRRTLPPPRSRQPVQPLLAPLLRQPLKTQLPLLPQLPQQPLRSRLQKLRGMPTISVSNTLKTPFRKRR